MWWFPSGRNDESGWRLVIVSLLAVIGESAMADHSQAMTASWVTVLPRILPAPQALLKPARPMRLPQANAEIVGVYNGTLIQTLNYFPNILHNIEELPAYAFQVYKITHSVKNPPPTTSRSIERDKDSPASNQAEVGQLEEGHPPPPIVHRRSTLRKLSDHIINLTQPRPHVPAKMSSPLNILSIFSFLLSLGLLALAIVEKDATACVALGTISIVSSIVGWASKWTPVLTNRPFISKVLEGDVVIRTRQGALIMVHCAEEVARELYTDTEECKYHVSTLPYRLLVGFGTLLLMISVVLLGNCEFVMQLAIGASYIFLNAAFWLSALVNKKHFWDVSSYEVEDVTPPYALKADELQEDTVERKPSFTRTLWYAIRETKTIGWVNRGGAAPSIPQWAQWLEAAEKNALKGNKYPLDSSDAEAKGVATVQDRGAQHTPATEVPLQATK